MNWAQLRAILWLRWRLTQNQFRRAGKFNAVLSVIMVVVLLLSAAGMGVGGVAGGIFAGRNAPGQVLLIIWDALMMVFLMFWFIGLMAEIQRSESIDLTKLLHLPITLQQVFVFNYVVSHFTPSIVLFLPGMLGLCAGLTVGAGPGMILLVPLVLGFVFMVTAWTYCLRGWLAALMVNKRRRRAVIVWITVAFVLVCQLPNFFFNSSYFREHTRGRPRRSQAAGKGAGQEAGGIGLGDAVVQAHLVLPPGWVGYGALALKEKNLWPVFGATAASWLLGALGLGRAYRMTIRFYQGADEKKKPKAVRQRATSRRTTSLVERKLPWLPDDTAGLALATLRSLLRTPEMKMAFIMPLVLGIVGISSQLTRMRRPPSELWAPFLASVAATVSVFSIAPIMANAFGLDRNGFRLLVLLPTRRHQILLAKNLAFFPFTAIVALTYLTAAKFLFHVSWQAVVAGLLQAATTFMLFSLMCNLLAILTPYRLAPGTLNAKKPKAVVFLAVFIMFLFLPLALVPVLIPPGLNLLFSALGWVPWLPVNLVATLVIFTLAGGLYWLLLPAQGRLLQRREQAILSEVTEEVE